MILPIVLFGNPILRQRGSPVRRFDGELRKFAEDMRETMIAHQGVGLAAQQVARALLFTVIDVTAAKAPSAMILRGRPVPVEEQMPLFLANPVLSLTKSKEIGNEGCLSFPGLRIDVPRSRRVSVQAQDLQGNPLVFEASGFLAVVIQHEVDHLYGKLFIDYLKPAQRKEIKEDLDRIRQGLPVVSPE
ncbi:Peptide deformylase 1 [Methylacidimicrobium cyclopophantes]|uniref:Peptide deformylase n=1 Tax=Methylacidimicrobium cyclopophantes TaxID=1041766 RepID=A0A5E6MHL5_9BACT|nr:peptide deformylase [Methylacidimicrobium cyclopophantes]VVM04986.1 Peptide deformylase 1 [Methylacidimicrobium cyclopophantes]